MCVLRRRPINLPSLLLLLQLLLLLVPSFPLKANQSVVTALLSPTTSFKFERIMLRTSKISTISTFSRRCLVRHMTSTHTKSDDENRNFASSSSPSSPQNIAIVGGGLAGLSAAYHLLNSTMTNANDASTLSLTIFDKSLPGKGGASSVAGG